MKSIKIAIAGYGNIGMGVDALCHQSAGLLTAKSTAPVEAKYLVDVRDVGDARHVRDIEAALADPEISVVAETIGGVGAAQAITRAALAAGRHVVTSNKQLVAEFGFDLQELAAKNGVQYRFEASVGGGIPLITPLVECLAFNKITRVMGILNGTTNYILTTMLNEGMSFDACLARAQKLGYAEPQPDADISGFDTCNKICILASMAFGHRFSTKYINTTGIARVTLPQLYEARARGRVLKLLGVAELSAEGEANLFVYPCELPESHPLAQVCDVHNAVYVRGDATGEVMFYGRGAGALPTASAVLADVLATTSPSVRPFWQGDFVKSFVSAPSCEMV